jgi:hypothetical protein
LWPDWLTTWLRIFVLRRHLRHLEEYFGRLAAAASKGDREQAVLAEWAVAARWPAKELSQLESHQLHRKARFWNLPVPRYEFDHETGKRYIPVEQRSQLKRKIRDARREGVRWWIRVLVIPVVSLVAAVAALMSMFLLYLLYW